MTGWNLPPGVSVADIEAQTAPCECESCPHDEVEVDSIGDVIDVTETRSVIVSVDGTCVACGATLTGRGQRTYDGIEDVDWVDVRDCPHTR